MRRVLMYSRHLVGIALRLCIELGYHRSATVARDAESPMRLNFENGSSGVPILSTGTCYSSNLQGPILISPSFMSYISKRPFGIGDSDIDAEVLTHDQR